MGDRGNIVIRASQNRIDDVWFYTHWSGYRIEKVAQDALAKKWRWGDTSYLARIVFDELTKDDQGSETGFGISTHIQDNERSIVVVDDDKQRVFLISEKELKEHRIPENYEPKKGNVWSYKDYINRKISGE